MLSRLYVPIRDGITVDQSDNLVLANLVDLKVVHYALVVAYI